MEPHGDEHAQVEVTDRMVPVAGGRLHVRTWRGTSATAAPIVLLHDSLGCVELWRSFPADLCRRTGRPVVAYDRLGFGRSDPRHGRLGPDFVAAEATAGIEPILDELDVDRWIGFGHSVGGGMALCAAGSLRGCIATVTEAAQAFVERRTTDGIREARAGFAPPGQLDRLRRYHGDRARWVLESWTETWLDPAFATWSLDAVLAGVTTPVLAIHGELDEYGSMAHPERIARLARGPVRIARLAGVHHVPHREVGAQVLDLVADFLPPAT